MSRTLLQIIELAAQKTGLEVIDGTANGSGGSTTTLVADALKKYPDNHFNGREVYIDGGSPSIRSLHARDFTGSSGTLTFTPALSAAPDGLAFMILPFERDVIVDAIVNAVLRLHDEGLLVRQVECRGIVTGSPLYNAGFDYWTSATTPDGWERNGSGTIARERASGNLYASAQSLKLSATADYVKQSEPWKRFLHDLAGQTVRFLCPVKTSTASIARINLYADGDNYSGYHTGGGGWEVLDTGEITLPDDAADIEPRLYNDGTAAVYFADPWLLTTIPVHDYPYPQPVFTRVSSIEMTGTSQRPDAQGRAMSRNMGRWQPVMGWTERYHHDEATTSAVGILHIDQHLPRERRLIVRGSGPLAVPSSDSDAVEVDYTESVLVATRAAAELLSNAITPATPPDVAVAYNRKIAELNADIATLSRGYGHQAQAVALPKVW